MRCTVTCIAHDGAKNVHDLSGPKSQIQTKFYDVKFSYTISVNV